MVQEGWGTQGSRQARAEDTIGTLVGPFPWTTTGRVSYATFRMRTRFWSNFKTTSSGGGKEVFRSSFIWEPQSNRLFTCAVGVPAPLVDRGVWRPKGLDYSSVRAQLFLWLLLLGWNFLIKALLLYLFTLVFPERVSL